MNDRADGAGGSPLWGGLLGGVLLGWSAMMLLAPELGSLVAVFGSPLLAWFVIVRLVGGGAGHGTCAVARRNVDAADGPTLSVLRADPALLARVSARSGGVCAACGGPDPLSLRAVLPVGRGSRALEQRFEALCAVCGASRRA